MIRNKIFSIFFKLAVFTIIIFSTALYPGTGEIQFERIAHEQGLTSKWIFSIIQDQKGFMWICTFNGLFKFDGYNFTTYNQEPANKNSLSSSNLRMIYEDKAGMLWVGTITGLNK